MKWLWKPNFNWADMICLFMAVEINRYISHNFWVIWIFLMITWHYNAWKKENNYHEPLPRSNP